jgi:hypothetical protein
LDESVDESMNETNFLVSSKDETTLLLSSKDETIKSLAKNSARIGKVGEEAGVTEVIFN